MIVIDIATIWAGHWAYGAGGWRRKKKPWRFGRSLVAEFPTKRLGIWLAKSGVVGDNEEICRGKRQGEETTHAHALDSWA